MLVGGWKKSGRENYWGVVEPQIGLTKFGWTNENLGSSVGNLFRGNRLEIIAIVESGEL